MQVDLKQGLTEAQRLLIKEDLQGFTTHEAEGESLLVSGEKAKLENFLLKHADAIERGLIAAPGSVVRTRGGSTYDVAEDGSWRKRQG